MIIIVFGKLIMLKVFNYFSALYLVSIISERAIITTHICNQCMVVVTIVYFLYSAANYRTIYTGRIPLRSWNIGYHSILLRQLISLSTKYSSYFFSLEKNGIRPHMFSRQCVLTLEHYSSSKGILEH